jgi:SAM-dependent methyltransferase
MTALTSGDQPDGVDRRAGISTKMKHDWNRRARTHTQFWIATGHHDTEEAFILSGIRDAEVLLRCLRSYHHPSHHPSWRALEIGCGIGRLLKPLATHFSRIDGIDIGDAEVRMYAVLIADLLRQPNPAPALPLVRELLALVEATLPLEPPGESMLRFRDVLRQIENRLTRIAVGADS